MIPYDSLVDNFIRIYSVGVWNGLKFADIEISSKLLEFTPLEFETLIVQI